MTLSCEKTFALALPSLHRRDILEILEDRYGKISTVIKSQLPISKWHGYIGVANKRRRNFG